MRARRARPPAATDQQIPMRIFTILALMGAASFGFTGVANAQCTETCATSGDGECDDGGENSIYAVCDYGTDCADCGPRVCSNTCSSPNDGECDDGGANSLYDICAIGTDCADCGARTCSNTCVSSNDNECDDGGEGSLYDICALGTDCADCGVR